MVERARLTDAIALAAQPREHEREYAIHDETLRGFMLRVQPGGSWVFRFRRDGKPRRVTLGQVRTVTADQARAVALALLAREKSGGRPTPPHLPARRLRGSQPSMSSGARRHGSRPRTRRPRATCTTPSCRRSAISGLIP